MKLDKLATHWQQDRYGDFWLTEAIRPGLDRQIVPEEGFRTDTYQDDRHGLRVPLLAAAVSREHLFDLFLDLTAPLGDIVDVVLESSHFSPEGRHRDWYREGIDLPVLVSHFCDFEDLLTNDGCTGVAIISREEPIEVQFDEHKLLLVYASQLKPFQSILERAGVKRKDHLRLLTEGTHLHNSALRHRDAFQQLCWRLGVGEPAERVSW